MLIVESNCLNFLLHLLQFSNYLCTFCLQRIPEAAEIAVPAAPYPISQTTETGGVTAGAVSGVRSLTHLR